MPNRFTKASNIIYKLALFASFYEFLPVWGEFFFIEHGVVPTVIASTALDALVCAGGAFRSAFGVFGVFWFVFDLCHSVCFIVT